MKRSERLNDMMIYLNDKKFFGLKSIMERYSISKSTALRDIQSLEAIGMPIYSTSGRNGRYGILPNRLLSPIVFTVEEVRALYFSMQTLSAHQSTPFHLDVQKLKQKFEGCISQAQIQKLRKLERIFSLGGRRSKNECGFLKDILDMAAEERACEILYRKGEIQKRYWVQFFDITSAYGQWYATAYNFQTERPQVFRCDKIDLVKACGAYAPRPLSELRASSKEMFRGPGAVDFEVGVSAGKGADIFDKEHYPSMELCHENGKCYVRGFYNPGEEAFIAGYFTAYGEAILSVRPDRLKDLILKRLECVKSRLLSL